MKKLTYLMLFVLAFSCQTQENKQQFFVKGVNYEAPSVETTANDLLPIKKLGANWISIMPYSFASLDNPSVQFNSKWQWRGEKEQGVLESINAAKANGLNVMIKPHLWFKRIFTGNIDFKNDDKWEIFEETYKDYVLFYAKLSEKYKVEMLCIGTEMKTFVNERPTFWNQLIQEVKTVYSGKITYAANWDNYDKIPFWNQLDYVGVDAYFPLHDAKTPQKNQLLSSWENWWRKIENTSKKATKPVIFTEIGYRSIDYTARKPWVSYEDFGNENQKAQKSCYEAFFESLKDKSFFKGFFLWKYHHPKHLPKKENEKYTFQGKLAEDYIKKIFID